jgi:ABC-type lipoprotein export system ATPase subunit
MTLPREALQSGLAVRAVGLGHVYHLDGEDVRALDEVAFDISAGESVAVLGPSGSGKSTLMSVLSGLRRASNGHLYVGSDDVTRMSERDLLRMRSERVGVVVQNPTRNLLPYGTAADNIRFAQRAAPRHRRSRLPDAQELLQRLGMDDLTKQAVGRMSGGEQQRLSVAVGMATAPGLLLADEPTSQLDSGNRDRVVDLLQRITASFGTTLIVVTHDHGVARALGRVITMTAGRASEDAGDRARHVRVEADGAIRLPADTVRRFPPGTRLRLVRKAGGIELHADPDPR